MNMDSFLENTESFEVFGIKIRKLKTNFEFIALCMHHYKDLNSLYLLSERGIKLSLFYDIKLYVTKKYIDVKELKFICDKLCISEYITFCLYHTNIIFPSDIIEHYLEFFVLMTIHIYSIELAWMKMSTNIWWVVYLAGCLTMNLKTNLIQF